MTKQRKPRAKVTLSDRPIDTYGIRLLALAAIKRGASQVSIPRLRAIGRQAIKLGAEPERASDIVQANLHYQSLSQRERNETAKLCRFVKSNDAFTKKQNTAANAVATADRLASRLELQTKIQALQSELDNNRATLTRAQKRGIKKAMYELGRMGA